MRYRHEEAKARLKFEDIARDFEVVAGSKLLAKGAQYLVLKEGNYSPVAYIPRSSVLMARLKPSETTSICPFKGEASYYSLLDEQGQISIKDIAWSYEKPIDEAKQLAGHLAFYPNKAALTESTK
ncbi:MAG: DUF427 domain-containing protein [Sphingomonadales bacterium]